MSNIKTNQGSKVYDLTGAVASTLCLIHCLSTPLIILGVLGLTSMESSLTPIWKTLDWFFLAITLIAVYRAASISKSRLIPYFFWMSWFVLLFIVVNEKVAFIELAEWLIIIPSVSLVALHLYNLKYCR